MTSLKQERDNIINRLLSIGVEQAEAKREAELIIEHVTGMPLAHQLASLDKELDNLDLESIKNILEARQEHKPLQYCFGKTKFMGLTLFVKEGVFIPRVDTEILVKIALEKIANIKEPKIFEIGVGSGAISIAILCQRKDAHVFGLDINRKAIELSLTNAQYHNVASRLKLIEKDILSFQLSDIDNLCPFDVIVSNPPYIPINQKANLQKEISLWEPDNALFGWDDDGLGFYRKTAGIANLFLKKGGNLIIEIGDKQDRRIAEILNQTGLWQDIIIHSDINNLSRVISASLL